RFSQNSDPSDATNYLRVEICTRHIVNLEVDRGDTEEESEYCSIKQDHSVDCGKIEEDFIEMATLGGLSDTQSAQNSVEIENLARFAIDQHNKKENVMLELARVVKAQEQVVAGTLHHLTLEVIEAGKKKLYEAKIWVKPWMSFKELQEFRHVGDADDAPSFTSSDLGVKQDAQESGWQSVPVHDPVVKDAADHAVTTIQQRSNSLFPYVLQEIVHAKAEINNDDILLSF
ncbi:hypothetical protein Leryth_010733, partial [Lithospermum erythrorhizon]